MNPFDLSGPVFLVFYTGVALIVVIGLKLVINEAERGAPRALPLSDPYHIAWLRGGTPEAARIAVLSLTDRSLLQVSGENLVNGNSAQLSVREPIERAILARCGQSGTPATAVLDDPAVESACEPYRARLERLQLMPDTAMRARRYRWCTVATAILLGVTLTKIAIAFSRGRYNVEFLVILTAVAVWGVWFLIRHPRTRLGDRMLEDLRRLFSALRQRAATVRRGAMTSDAMLLAAVFGLSALPATGFADLQHVYKKATKSAGGCGAGCGSGCGGGGGGGGCGGCGSGS
jgi:uncharacterized protein (TIGR04222 family)